MHVTSLRKFLTLFDKHFLVILLCCLGTGLLMGKFALSADHFQEPNVALLPDVFNGWESRELPIGDDVLSIIKPDAAIFRNYVRNGNLVNVFMGYYADLGRSDASHSPLVCYPGSGFTITDNSAFNLEVAGRMLNFRRLVVSNGIVSEVVLYGYGTPELTTGSLIRMRLHLVASSFLNHTSTNAFIRFSSTIKNGDEEAAGKQLSVFVENYYGYFDEFLADTRRI